MEEENEVDENVDDDEREFAESSSLTRKDAKLEAGLECSRIMG